MEERDECEIWTELVEQWMEANDDEYGEFGRIPESDRLHPARKLCGFLKLASLMKEPSEFSMCAEHDNIFLPAPEELRRDVTEADIVYLIRCSIRWDDNGYFATFTSKRNRPGSTVGARPRHSEEIVMNEFTEGTKIYTASRVRHAHLWIALRDRGVPISSTWIDEAGEGQSASLSDLWVRCVKEASEADALIVYIHPDDGYLKGALVEVGSALACGVPVCVVGKTDASWVHHPLVGFRDTIEEAVNTFRIVNETAPAVEPGQ